jgi:hypothetical protein
MIRSSFVCCSRMTAEPADREAFALRSQAGTRIEHTTVTVVITAIDPKVPSVTFKGPAGNTRPIKVRYPALAITVEKAAKK